MVDDVAKDLFKTMVTLAELLGFGVVDVFTPEDSDDSTVEAITFARSEMSLALAHMEGSRADD